MFRQFGLFRNEHAKVCSFTFFFQYFTPSNEKIGRIRIEFEWYWVAVIGEYRKATQKDLFELFFLQIYHYYYCWLTLSKERKEISFFFSL